MKTSYSRVNSFKHGIIACLLLCTCIVYNQAFAQLTAQAVQQETLTLVQEFSAPSHGTLYPDQTYTPVTTYNGATYLVWVDLDRYPMLAKIENGVVQTARLDNNNDYKPLDNGHHKFSIGIDNDGYIHIAGDMHGYPYTNVGHLPDDGFYDGGRCMYWVSDSPENISSFTFQGHSNQAPQGQGHTYIYFANDNNGVLYYASRAQIPGQGPQGANVERYDPSTKTWTQLGGDFHNSGKKMLVWENTGTAASYQGMRSDIRFDKNNRMHFTVITRRNGSGNPVDNGAKSGSGVIYAYSDDGGDNWNKADGTAITGYPMWMNAGANQGDIIVDNETYISMPASVAFNQDNEPFVHYTYTNNNVDVAKYRQWSNSNQSWGPITDLPINAFGWDRQWNDGRGVITLSSLFTGELYRTSSLTETGVKYDMSFTSVDRRYLSQTGELRGISQSEVNGVNTISVARLVTDLPDANGNTGNPIISAFSQIEAEDFNDQSGVQLSNGGSAVGYIGTGDWIKFDNVNFGSGANTVVANLSKGSTGTGTVEIRRGGINGLLLGQLDVTNTGGWTSFQNVAGTISNTTGVTDIYLVFTGSLDVDWIQFSNTIIPISAFSQIEAEDYDSQSGTQLSNGGTAVGYIDTGDWIRFDNVDFGSGASSVTANVSKGSTGTGIIEFRQGSVSGTLLGQVNVANTGDWTTFVNVTGTITNASGIEDLYLVFTDGLDVDWIQFTSGGGSTISAFSQIEAEDYDDQSGVQLSNGGTSVGYIDGGDWIKFENVDFGSGASSVTANVAKGNNGTRTIEFREGSVTGTLLGQVQFSNTGGWSTFIDVTGAISNATGVIDLYLVFPNNYLDVNWIQFSNGNARYTATQTEVIKDAQILLYPNPSSDLISIGGMDDIEDAVRIYGLSGNLLIETRQTNNIDISSLDRGLYLIKVGKHTLRLLKK